MFFSEAVGTFETKIHLKVDRTIGMKTNTNEFGHMTKMTAMPIYG